MMIIRWVDPPRPESMYLPKHERKTGIVFHMPYETRLLVQNQPASGTFNSEGQWRRSWEIRNEIVEWAREHLTDGWWYGRCRIELGFDPTGEQGTRFSVTCFSDHDALLFKMRWSS